MLFAGPQEGGEAPQDATILVSSDGELTLHLAISLIIDYLDLGEDLRVPLVVDLLGERLVLLLDDLVHLRGHLASVEMVLEVAEDERIGRHLVTIDISSLQLCCNGALYVDEPVSRLPRAAALGRAKHVFLRYISHPNIIELTPLLLEPIIYEGVVVSTSGIAIVDANGMQMIGLLLHFRDAKCRFDLGLEVVHLLLHLAHLV